VTRLRHCNRPIQSSWYKIILYSAIIRELPDGGGGEDMGLNSISLSPIEPTYPGISASEKSTRTNLPRRFFTTLFRTSSSFQSRPPATRFFTKGTRSFSFKETVAQIHLCHHGPVLFCSKLLVLKTLQMCPAAPLHTKDTKIIKSVASTS